MAEINILEETLKTRTCIGCLKLGCICYCGKCGKATYCSQECKRKDRDDHQRICKQLKDMGLINAVNQLRSANVSEPTPLMHTPPPIRPISMYPDLYGDLYGDSTDDISIKEVLNTALAITSQPSNLLQNTLNRAQERQQTTTIRETDEINLNEFRERKRLRKERLKVAKEKAKKLLPFIRDGSRRHIREAMEIKQELEKLTIENDLDVLLLEDLETRKRVCREDIELHLHIVVSQEDVTEPPAFALLARQLVNMHFN